jgi:hypothetical protein
VVFFVFNEFSWDGEGLIVCFVDIDHHCINLLFTKILNIELHCLIYSS